jgi:hypothetical protein
VKAPCESVGPIHFFFDDNGSFLSMVVHNDLPAESLTAANDRYSTALDSDLFCFFETFVDDPGDNGFLEKDLFPRSFSYIRGISITYFKIG